MPYHYPSAEKLKKTIYEILDPSSGTKTRTLLKNLQFKDDAIDELRKGLSETPLYSIDAYLEKKEHLVSVGKAAIACALIPIEKNELLFKPKKDEGWYQYLFNLMNGNLDRFRNADLDVLTYNYDRSFEYYFYWGLKKTHNTSDVAHP